MTQLWQSSEAPMCLVQLRAQIKSTCTEAETCLDRTEVSEAVILRYEFPSLLLLGWCRPVDVVTGRVTGNKVVRRKDGTRERNGRAGSSS